MKNNIETFANKYYQAVYKRNNLIKNFILGNAIGLSSFPRMLIENFIRRDMGQRYFSLSHSLLLCFALAYYPYSRAGYDPDWYNLIMAFPLWYMYLAAFLIATIIRYREISRHGNVIIIGRLTVSTGKVSKVYKNFWTKILGTLPDKRLMECYLEPLPFLMLGFVLLYIEYLLGALIIISAVCYSVSYMGAYYFGDEEIMDIRDTEEIAKSLKNLAMGMGSLDGDSDEIYFSKRPRTDEDRRRMLGLINDEDDEDGAVVV